jgi:hypothetical protein
MMLLLKDIFLEGCILSRLRLLDEKKAEKITHPSYVTNLEQRVTYLEFKLQEHGIQYRESEAATRCHTPSSPAVLGTPLPPRPQQAGSNSPAELAAQATLERVRSLDPGSSRDEPAFSQILLTELTRPKVIDFSQAATINPRPSDVAVAKHGLYDAGMASHLDATPVSFPSKDAALGLVKAYFAFANGGMPLLHEPTFREQLELLYRMPLRLDLAETHSSPESRKAAFFLFEVLAVALVTMQKQDPSRASMSVAERYHAAALEILKETGLPDGVGGVQALLLVSQYSYLHPTLWAVWKALGTALRLVVELGLYQDPPADKVDPLAADTIRRVFWVAYCMDRGISIALKKPSCLSDGAITTKVCVRGVSEVKFIPHCLLRVTPVPEPGG